MAAVRRRDGRQADRRSTFVSKHGQRTESGPDGTCGGEGLFTPCGRAVAKFYHFRRAKREKQTMESKAGSGRHSRTRSGSLSIGNGEKSRHFQHHCRCTAGQVRPRAITESLIYDGPSEPKHAFVFATLAMAWGRFQALTPSLTYVVIITTVNCSTLCGVPSVAMFCFVFFREFRLPNRAAH